MAGQWRTDIELVDAHTHLTALQPEAVDAMLEPRDGYDVAFMNLLMLSLPSSGYINTNPEGLHAKWRRPNQVFLFAALDYTALLADVDLRLAYSLPEQVRRLQSMGCDGMKMLTGMPHWLRQSGISLDCIIFEPYFATLEAAQFPLLWHVNHPEEFWDTNLIPAWAREGGLFYDATFPTKESIYSQCYRVLERHPQLTVIFPHFYFLADDLPRAADLLDRFPGVYLDLTPWTMMYRYFYKRLDKTREFFLKYQDRLIFGTDLAGGGGVNSSYVLVREFLETEGELKFSHPDLGGPIEGISLPLDSLRKIYAANYQRVVSPRPRPLRLPLALAELNRLAGLQDQLGAPRNTARFFANLMAGGIPSDWERKSVFEGYFASGAVC